MKEHAFFSYKRLALLFRQHYIYKRTPMMYALIALFLFMYVVLVYRMRYSPHRFFQMPESSGVNNGYFDFFLFTLLGFAAGVGLTFSGLGTKSGRMEYLLIPASTFEKYVYPLINQLILIVVYLIIFWMSARLAVMTYALLPGFVVETIKGYNNEIRPFDFSMFFASDYIWFLFIGLLVAAYLYVVPLFFKRWALIKTVLSFFILLFVVASLFVLNSHVFFAEETRGFNIGLHVFGVGKGWNNMEVFAFSALNVLTLVLFWLGYHKLKEIRL